MINNDDYQISETDFTGWSHRSISGKIITIALLLIIIASIVAISWILITRVNNNILEFYILNESGKADDYPLAIGRGDEFSIIAGVINNGKQETLCTIKTSINDIAYGETEPFTLKQNEKHDYRLDAGVFIIDFILLFFAESLVFRQRYGGGKYNEFPG